MTARTIYEGARLLIQIRAATSKSGRHLVSIMKLTSWFAYLALIAGCGFGDNQSLQARPDSGVAGTKPDGGVIQPTDAASPDTPVASCTLVPQGGCSGSTPACDLHDDGSTFCRAVTSQGTSNNHCSADTECKQGYSCTDDGTANPAWCARFCQLDTHCTGTGSRCVNELTNGSMPLGVYVCSNACDPYGQSGCPTGMGCLPFEASGGDFTDCQYMGTKLAGQSCTYSTDCGDGLICVSTNNVKTCKPICVVGNNGTCGVGQCIGFVNTLTIGGVTYGACT